MSRFLAPIPAGWRLGLHGWMIGAFLLSGCAGHSPNAANYVVRFSVTRTADHAPISSAAVPVAAGGEGKRKVDTGRPAENQPVATEFLARLNRTRRTGVYELVARVTVKEAIRNKKGKLKISKRNIGGLVPTRLGEFQTVNAEGDPIHVEARLEHR